MVNQLIAAARRGVRVRLIVDGFGSPGFVRDYWPRLEKARVRVRFFRAFPWLLKRLPGDPHSLIRRIYLRLRRANRGDHRKFCLIDQSQLWVGSFNISDVHLHEVYGEQAWKDIGVRVRGAELKYARRAFERAYRGWTALNLPARSPRMLLLNDSLLHKRRARMELVLRLKQARERIWLATPYFVPVGPVFRQLLKRAREGVDVRIIIPRKNDVWHIKLLSIPLLKTLSAEGAKIFVYEPRFSHQKLFIADDWVSVGSTNLNHRSFLHDLEMDIVITHEKNKERVVSSYVHDQSLSQPFNATAWSQLSLWERLCSSIFILLRYWS
ncbi:MAG: phosphatidylserine/phosphatidylglycerophosphate/cardiolipin synthase family protein [Calothrix sp. SM1_5_4]|nr:phosphatidylserine/phosphatidylglycerophosphate/cardiolipin synthase family protein [Calothrix sp. SM1_5_4]